MIVLIDNYDSFTYNLVQTLAGQGAELQVFRNDAITVDEVLALRPDGIVVSPGPCTPREAGISVELIRRVSGTLPLLGVCLGHQSIGEAFGATVSNAKRIMHGKVSMVTHGETGLYQGLKNPFAAGRYHSLAVLRHTLPPELVVDCESEDGEIMGMHHTVHPTYGVQYHPESVLTPAGKRLLRNFLDIVSAHTGAARRVKAFLEKLVRRQDLTQDESARAFDAIMAGEATPAQIGAFIAMLRQKGESVDELAGGASSLRRHAVFIDTGGRPVVDTCGTGGDDSGTFNISTAAAFVTAGAGVPVAKHGNRAITSRCGSADVLAELGVNLDAPPETVEECVREAGMGFLFAPKLHPAMKHAMGPRKELGIRTIFNMLGPLSNPAGAKGQLIGVFAAELTEPFAHVLRLLGSRRAFVVHGHDGMDEITSTDRTRVSELADGRVRTYDFDPAEFIGDYARAADLAGGAPAVNAAIIRSVLDGKPGPARDIVCLNAAAAIVAGEKAQTMAEGWRAALDSIDSGRARQALESLVRVSQAG